MQKKLYILNSQNKNRVLLEKITRNFSAAGWDPCLIADHRADQNKNQHLNKNLFNPKKKNFFHTALFALSLPTARLALIKKIVGTKPKNYQSHFLCADARSAILAAPAAKLFKMSLSVMLFPEELSESMNQATVRLLRRAVKKSRLIIFSGISEAWLEKHRMVSEKQIKIAPGAEISRWAGQEMTPDYLVKAKETDYKRKFFTIGAIADLSERHNLEHLLRAIELCRSVIPNIQLVIVGDGPERKNLSWIAKSMGIDTSVWFVGAQTNRKKWLESFDVFVVVSSQPSFDSFTDAFFAMAAGVPSICPANNGFEDYIKPMQNGIIADNSNNESIAQAIINLHQKKHIRQAIAVNARIDALNNFSFEGMMEKLDKILSEP